MKINKFEVTKFSTLPHDVNKDFRNLTQEVRLVQSNCTVGYCTRRDVFSFHRQYITYFLNSPEYLYSALHLKRQ